MQGTSCSPSRGNFISHAPAGMRFIGIELDGLSGRIARVLHPDADIRIEDFSDTQLPQNRIDAVIGNVPFADKVTFDWKGRENRCLSFFATTRSSSSWVIGNPILAAPASKSATETQPPGARFNPRALGSCRKYLLRNLLTVRCRLFINRAFRKTRLGLHRDSSPHVLAPAAISLRPRCRRRTS